MTAGTAPRPVADADAELELWGHYAGFVSRFAAYAADLGVITGVFMLTLAAASWAASIITGHAINWSREDLPVGIAYGAWWFLYFAYQWSVNGKTFGMALLGIRVVSSEGDVAGPHRAILRTIVFPLSFLLLGLGFVGIVIGHERRALHDVIAGTAVVYTWHARAARLRYLVRDDLSQIPASRRPAQAARAPSGPALSGPALSGPVPQQAGAPRHDAAVTKAMDYGE